MKQLKTKAMKWSSLFLMAAAMTAMTACSDDDNKGSNGNDPEVTYPTGGDADYQ